DPDLFKRERSLIFAGKGFDLSIIVMLVNGYMRIILVLLSLAFLSSCADAGYQPSYIISKDKVTNEEEQIR
ncbi:MAG TPA: hypothetical protein VIJ46_05550, partial [Rhabdochlamydiaceae bacterium]